MKNLKNLLTGILILNSLFINGQKNLFQKPLKYNVFDFVDFIKKMGEKDSAYYYVSTEYYAVVYRDTLPNTFPFISFTYAEGDSSFIFEDYRANGMKDLYDSYGASDEDPILLKDIKPEDILEIQMKYLETINKILISENWKKNNK